MENLLDIGTARRVLGGVSEWTIYRLARNGELPVVKIGDRTFFRPEDVQALIERHVKTSAEAGAQ